MGSIILTGGAGFIGSCLLRELNDKGNCNIYVVDHIEKTEKWRNLTNKEYLNYIHKSKLGDFLCKLENVDAVIHLGACSSTTEKDFDYLWDNNVEYSKMLWNYCVEKGCRFIYASSAATYGSGSEGFNDEADIGLLRPLNGYGYSKQVFDVWTNKQSKRPRQCVGLKFFNVYGPNEYCKGSMASMVYHGFNQIKQDGEIRLFKSMNENYEDGGQLRDFVYVKDVCNVIMWLLDHEEVNGIYNVGTGRSQSFRELAEATFEAMNLKPNIRYIDMPEELIDRYQYYTQADMKKLRAAGYTKDFRNVKSGVADYVKEHLLKGYRVY